jgi:hypothetical protein
MSSTTSSNPSLACQSCGAAGALQHAPPPAPVSGIWCTRCYARLEKKGQWLNLLYRFRVLWFFVVVALMVMGQKAFASEFKSAAECVVGKRVVTREKQAGVIVKADGSSCHVKLDSTGKTDYNIFWMLRQEGNTQPGGSALAPGLYPCYMLAGTNLNYAFIDIRIDGPGRYRDKSGAAGSYSVLAGDKIVFTGPLASANAKLLPGGRIGLNMDGGGFFDTSCSLKQ